MPCRAGYLVSMRSIRCIRCGYELGASDRSGACPECAAPVEASARVWSVWTPGRRRALAGAVAATLLAWVGWWPLTLVAFDRAFPEPIRRVVERLLTLGGVRGEHYGAIGFTLTGVMLAVTMLLLAHALGWRGRRVRVGLWLVAALMIGQGMTLARACVTPRLRDIELGVLWQAVLCIPAILLWWRLQRAHGSGRGAWAIATLSAVPIAAIAWGTPFLFPPPRTVFDPGIRMLVAGVAFGLLSSAASGWRSLRSHARSLSMPMPNNQPIDSLPRHAGTNPSP